jgi:hypothetical protein
MQSPLYIEGQIFNQIYSESVDLSHRTTNISNERQQNCREMLTLSKTVKDDRKTNFEECTFGMLPMNPKD